MLSFMGKQAADGAACLMLFASLLPLQVYAAGTGRANFNASFLKNMTGLNSDLSRFASANAVDPGKYVLDVYLNNERIGTEKIRVIQTVDGAKTCFPYRLLRKIPLKQALSVEKQQKLEASQSCVSFAELFDEGSMRLNIADLQMIISLPQASLVRHARGFVSPEMWESGANALNLNYSLNAWRSVTGHQQYDSVYARTLAGFNFYGWMLRHEGSFNWQNQADSGRYYEAVATYMQKDIPPLKSRLLFGDGNTSGDLFDTLSFRGVQLSSVEQMWPDSLRGYAPQIRGVADSTAQVTVSQNGTRLYETTVSPGAFLIDDLYPTGYGGDLDVTVKEADGSEKRFSIPYSAGARLKRPGMTAYAVTAGFSRIANLVYMPKVFQATVQHGLTNSLTGYAGLQGTDNAVSLLLGAAIGLPVGAFSTDVIAARTEYGKVTDKGVNLRAAYSKKIAATSTNIIVTLSRSSAGYFSYGDAVRINNDVKKDRAGYELSRSKERISLSARQQLGERYGTLHASGYLQNYWNRSDTRTQFQLGYSNNMGSLIYSLSATRLFYDSGTAETAFTLDFSLPLGGRADSRPPYLTGTASHSPSGLTTQSAIHGVTGAASQTTYSVGVTRDSDSHSAASMSALYKSPWTSLQIAGTKGGSYYSISGGLSGSLVTMADSMTFSAYQATTLAVVNAEQAQGARVSGYPNIVLDSSGRAIVPNLSPYKINELSLDPKGMPAHVELKQTSRRVVPVEGAIMKVAYQSISGRPLLIRATQAGGAPLPFGAKVSDESGNTLATVMQGGQIYLRLNQDEAKLKVFWGSAQQNSCGIALAASELKVSGHSSLTQLSKKCI